MDIDIYKDIYVYIHIHICVRERVYSCMRIYVNKTHIFDVWNLHFWFSLLCVLVCSLNKGKRVTEPIVDYGPVYTD